MGRTLIIQQYYNAMGKYYIFLGSIFSPETTMNVKVCILYSIECNKICQNVVDFICFKTFHTAKEMSMASIQKSIKMVFLKI